MPIKALPDHIKAIIMSIGAGFLIISMNAFAKKAAEYHDPIEIVFYRGLVAMILLLIYVAYKKRTDFYKTTRMKSHFGRAFIGNCGVIAVFWSYKLLPMADVTALLFSSPFIVTVLSALILKEKVGIYRWLAILIGFIGVVMIVGPSLSGLHGYAVFVPLLASLCMGFVAIFLRDLGKTEDSITTVFYFLLFGVLYSGVYMVFKGSFPAPDAMGILFCVGLAAFVQLILKTEAYRLAEASMLSPYTYIMLIWAALIGWIFWGDVPDIWVWIGASVIIVSNLFITWREQKNKQKKDAAIEVQI